MRETTYRIGKNIGEELNLANWRIKIKLPIFYLANLFCILLTQNLARDTSAVAVIQVEQSHKNTWRPCLQLLILSNSEHVFIIIVTIKVTMAMLNDKRIQATNSRFCLSKTSKKHRSRLTDLISYGTAIDIRAE